MLDNPHASGDVIRKAGKATAVLQVFAVILLALLAWVYTDISSRYSALQDGIRENAMWSIYQMDREARRVAESLTIILAKNDNRPETLKTLSLRYDILYSRMATIDKARFEKNFSLDATIRKRMQGIRRTVFQNVHIFDDIQAGRGASIASLKILQSEFGAMVKDTEELTSYTNNVLSTERADARTAVEALGHKSIVLIALLFVSVVFLIFTLRRQLSNMRAAGLSLESMARKLGESFRAAEAGNQAKSQFMATMGHEIRTPLNAILGMVELMEMNEPADDHAGNLRTIRRSGEALLDIINEILDFAKIEHGNLELEIRRVDVRALAENAAEMMRGRAAESGNRIDLDIPAELSNPVIDSDPTRLRQVILNLMSNALKFTTNGVVGLSVREVHHASSPWLRVEVTDTGIGIDTAGREKLFKPFSQVDASISRKYGGTGLGLTICKQIIDRFGGRMDVDSELGRGSTFWFEVPAPRAMLPAPASSDTAMDERPLPRLSILVVEDNLVNQQVISRFLAHLGQDVVLADNGAIAVETAARQHFDLILMDMQMPVMDGIEATREIKTLPRPFSDVPVIAMTANASEDDRRRCGEAGMTGFQSKPVSLLQLRTLLAGVSKTTSADPAPVAQADTTATASVPPVHAAEFERRRQEISEALGEDVFLELLESFFDDAVSILGDLREAMQRGEHGRVEPLLHNLKGVAANVGLADISATAQQLRDHSPTLQDIEALCQSIDARKTELAA